VELAVRKGKDVFVPAGAFGELTRELRQHQAELAELPAVVVSCCDRRTRLLPFVIYDSYIFPAGARTVAATLYQAGFTRTRAVFQLWNRNFDPSQARMDGLRSQLLLVSGLSLSSAEMYRVIRDAWKLGEERPLIIAGGPKGIYQPYDFWPLPTPGPKIGPDIVVTGEAFVLLDLVRVLVQHRGRGESLRNAFERARREGALESVPGLVYLAPGASYEDPHLIDTGLQRLVQNFDELPDEIVGLSLLEPPHRGKGLSPQPVPLSKVRRYSPIVSLQLTQGCKFACSYCPIPAVNQKSWRFRTPEGIARQFKTIHDQTRIKCFFGSDDNFFNRRETAESMLEAVARTFTARHRPLGGKIRWGTEATQFDTYKNRDLLPLAKRAGLAAIWFGIEDLTAELINKGQKPEVTVELFRLMREHDMAPMAMMMYHDGQPFHTRDSLYGISNQMRFLQRVGAISVQCTVHSPAVGTKEYEKTFATGKVIAALGRTPVEDRRNDGNHVIVAGSEPSWRRQLKHMGAYASFYNPLNLLRALRRDGSRLRKVRIAYQIIGMIALLWTALKTLPYLVRLAVMKPRYHETALPAFPVPVHLPAGAFPRLPVQTPEPAGRRKDRLDGLGALIAAPETVDLQPLVSGEPAWRKPKRKAVETACPIDEVQVVELI
jgi:radical SAM superfamily enzyme YgiQ (UPF0313 family)